mgnify:CR=1 FL=1
MDEDPYPFKSVSNQLTFDINVEIKRQSQFLNELLYYSYEGVHFHLEKQKTTFHFTIYSNDENILLSLIKTDIENILERIEDEKNNWKFWQ